MSESNKAQGAATTSDAATEIKIISRSTSYLERSIIYEVNGEKKLVKAPVGVKTFKELEAEIYAQNGGERVESNAVDDTASSERANDKKPRRATRAGLHPNSKADLASPSEKGASE